MAVLLLWSIQPLLFSKNDRQFDKQALSAFFVDEDGFFVNTHLSSGGTVPLASSLLFGNAEIPRTFIEHEQRDLPRPVVQLIGRDASGAFKTSYAKEYPEGMNRCFAVAFWDKITRTFPTLDDHSGAFPAFAAKWQTCPPALSAVALCCLITSLSKTELVCKHAASTDSKKAERK